jgi:hypothetical protein
MCIWLIQDKIFNPINSLTGLMGLGGGLMGRESQAIHFLQ